MIDTGLLTRPWSGHVPKVEGYEPSISAKIARVSRRRKNSWQCQVLVAGAAMFTSHHDTKRAAEAKAEGMLNVYTDVHYLSK